MKGKPRDATEHALLSATMTMPMRKLIAILDVDSVRDRPANRATNVYVHALTRILYSTRNPGLLLMEAFI